MLLDASREPNVIADSARVVAELFKAVTITLPARTPSSITSGSAPAARTARGGADPLREVGYPAYAERDKAFAEFRKSAGDSAAAPGSAHFSYIYVGNPKEAIRYFLDAFGRCRAEEIQVRADDLVLIGARAARGHGVGLDQFYAFLSFGPAGPDGKPGTANDLTDPFAPLVK